MFVLVVFLLLLGRLSVVVVGIADGRLTAFRGWFGAVPFILAL